MRDAPQSSSDSHLNQKAKENELWFLAFLLQVVDYKFQTTYRTVNSSKILSG